MLSGGGGGQGDEGGTNSAFSAQLGRASKTALKNKAY